MKGEECWKNKKEKKDPKDYYFLNEENSKEKPTYELITKKITNKEKTEQKEVN